MSGGPSAHGTGENLGVSAGARLAACGAVAALGAAGLATVASWRVSLLGAWILAAAVFVGWMLRTILPMGAAATAQHAAREDPGRAASHTIVLVSAAASLGAVALLLMGDPAADGGRFVRAALSLAAVALAWLVTHVAFTTRYAHLYFTAGQQPIDFGHSLPPRYRDFAYLAFTVGMTYQVSDTQISSPSVRQVVLGHALFSFLLGVVIIAGMINLMGALLA